MLSPNRENSLVRSQGDSALIHEREKKRRLRIKLAALKRHASARDPYTGKSLLAVAAGKASGIQREGDRVWGLEMALRRWDPRHSDNPIGPSHH